MQAFRIPELGAAPVWAEAPVPSPAPHEVLVKMLAAGICRTDLEIMDHRVHFGLPWNGAFTLGHENVGKVVAAGSEVKRLAVGENVVIMAGSPCGECRNCLRGNDNYCSDRVHQYGTRDDGGLAPYMVARERDAFSIGGLDPMKAAPLGDAGATAYGTVNHVLPAVADDGFVVVIGAGGVGAFALQLLRLKTTATVIAVDLPDRLGFARERGAHVIIPSDENTAAAINELTKGAGVDAVLDFVGNDATLGLSAKVTRELGRVALVGTAGGSVPFSFSSSRHGVSFMVGISASMAEVVELLNIAERGLITVDAVPYAFNDLERAYEDLRQGKVVGRAVLSFDE